MTLTLKVGSPDRSAHELMRIHQPPHASKHPTSPFKDRDPTKHLPHLVYLEPLCFFEHPQSNLPTYQRDECSKEVALPMAQTYYIGRGRSWVEGYPI